MSHFCVAVIAKNNNFKEVEELLKKYDENLEVEPRIKRTKEQMISDAKKYKQDLENKLESDLNKKIAGYQKKYLDAKTDLELYLCERETDEEYDVDGNELTTYNPNSKWDWYALGGRYNNMIVVDRDDYDVCCISEPGLGMKISDNVDGHPELKKVNGAKIKNIHFNMMGGDYNEAIRKWELLVEGQKANNEDEKRIVDYNFHSPEYYIYNYGTKEEYARQVAMFTPWAFLNEEGWFEMGNMGWFALSDASKESRLSYLEYLNSYLNAPEHQEEYLFIIDCHI